MVILVNPTNLTSPQLKFRPGLARLTGTRAAVTPFARPWSLPELGQRIRLTGTQQGERPAGPLVVGVQKRHGGGRRGCDRL